MEEGQGQWHGIWYPSICCWSSHSPYHLLNFFSTTAKIWLRSHVRTWEGFQCPKTKDHHDGSSRWQMKKLPQIMIHTDRHLGNNEPQKSWSLSKISSWVMGYQNQAQLKSFCFPSFRVKRFLQVALVTLGSSTHSLENRSAQIKLKESMAECPCRFAGCVCHGFMSGRNQIPWFGSSPPSCVWLWG